MRALLLFLAVFGLSRSALAEAKGFELQARMPVQQGLTSVTGIDPAFFVGYRADGYSLGLGASIARFGFSTSDDVVFDGSTLGEEDFDGSATAIIVAPTLKLNVWESSDSAVQADVLVQTGIGLLRGSVTETNVDVDFSDPLMPTAGGTWERSTSVSALLIPFRLGFGGDYFFHPNFAIGAEAGLNLNFLTNVSTSEELSGQVPDGITASPDDDIDVGFVQSALYGLVRVTVVIGD